MARTNPRGPSSRDWNWSGSNLGGPSALEQQLPFAALLAISQSIGGSAELAQRAWFTGLFAGMAICAFGLLLVLGIRPFPAGVGALAYAFSPFVVANAVPNPVYMSAMAMLPYLLAIVVAGGTKQLRTRTCVILMGASAPLIGYVDLNPPLLGMLIVGIILAPAGVGWLFGRAAAYRSLKALALGLTLLVALSSYWVVPSVLQLVVVGTPTQLAGAASWSWTEGRATILNAFWLNTAWGWVHPEYFPFAHQYDAFPLSQLRFAPPVLAFAALYLVKGRQPGGHLALAVISATVALSLLFLSTGTNPPGNILFDPLYALPLGWLLREPGKFLIVADLMYGILIALTTSVVLGFLAQTMEKPMRVLTSQSAWLSMVALLVVLPGLPLATGSIVSDNRPELPPMHVRLPVYWSEMSAFIDATPQKGAVLVLPPDDYYQMPYRWGYDGNDQFIVDLMHRQVLNPTTGYFAASDNLMRVVNLVAQSMVTGDFELTGRLLAVLGTPLLLVRRDLDPSYPGRSFIDPELLGKALLRAPNFDLLHASGPLLLFHLRGVDINAFETPGYYATIGSSIPDLRILTRLPENSALVSGAPHTGIASVQEVPGVAEWAREGDQMTWSFNEQPGWRYEVVSLDSEMKPEPIDDLLRTPNSANSPRFRRIGAAGQGQIVMMLTGQPILSNGDFRDGPWGPVGDCNNLGDPTTTRNYLDATVVPVGGSDDGPFLELSARMDNACESRSVKWQRGPVLVSLTFRHVSGGSPSLCMWETGPNRCASLPALVANGQAWTRYTAAMEPDNGTTALDLFLYSPAAVRGTWTRNDYSDITVLQLPRLPHLDVIASPPQSSNDQMLLVHHSSYSPSWRGPAGSTHVAVDGLLNGWILSPGRFSASYSPEQTVAASFVVTTVAVGVLLALLFSVLDLRGVLADSRRRLGARWQSRLKR